MRLYYFTSEKYALANLENRRLKVSFPDKVNDLFEMKPFDFGNSAHSKDDRRRWQECIAGVAKTGGFISFTEHWSTPTMWAHYAHNNLGVCYGFDVTREGLIQIKYEDKLRPFNEQVLSKVNTLKREMDFADELRPFNEPASPDMILLKREMDYAKKTKSSHWRYEKEWRHYVELDDEKIILKAKGCAPFYVDFNENLVIREVIIGAESKITSACIKRVLRPEDNIKIRTARPSFRKYEIVEQKDRRLQK